MKPHFGMSDKELKEVSKHLNDFLADTYALYLKTQNFHWNLTGPEFISLHLLFEKQYEELADAVDEIAERIRILGFFVEATFSAFDKKAKISGESKKISQTEMLKRLVKDHEYIVSTYGPYIPKFQGLHDEVSADLLIKRLTDHGKAAWFLRSHLINI
jgi:starvation-inducible DNA-binding protein